LRKSNRLFWARTEPKLAPEEEEIRVNTVTQQYDSISDSAQGVVYRASCQNRGCGFEFDLKVTPANSSCLSGFIACPYCHRHGGFLKPQGRIGDKRFAAKLYFRVTGVVSANTDGEDEDV